jgi:transcription elongation factor/antiterminator RfaH
MLTMPSSPIAQRDVGDVGQHSPITLAPDERWYAVHTLPFGEARAEGNLAGQDFRIFMPKRRKTIRHARRLTTVEAPFFPRYLFIALDMGRDQWRRVNSTFGVARLIMRGEEPRPVPGGVVEALVASSDARGILQLGPTLRVGGPVRLMAGPFAEHLAILDQLDESGRVRVLLDILGRQVTISTRTNNVIPIARN